MEENLSILTQIKKAFACEEQDIKTYSPLTLAYIGDGIYELIVRTVIIQHGNTSPESIHRKVTRIVKAETQCLLYAIWDNEQQEDAPSISLTEQERAVLRRGRNARSYTKAKNASVADYRKATGVEALFGYLYLTDQIPRAIALLQDGLGRIGTAI